MYLVVSLHDEYNIVMIACPDVATVLFRLTVIYMFSSRPTNIANVLSPSGWKPFLAIFVDKFDSSLLITRMFCVDYGCNPYIPRPSGRSMHPIPSKSPCNHLPQGEGLRLSTTDRLVVR